MNRDNYRSSYDFKNRSKPIVEDPVRYTRGEGSSQIYRNPQRRKFYQERSTTYDHSVSLLPHTNGPNILVSKKSPLLHRDIIQRFRRECMPKNKDLLELSKREQPVDVDDGCKRIILPPLDKPLRLPFKKYQMPFSVAEKTSDYSDSPSSSDPTSTLSDNPPPLVVAPIYEPDFPSQSKGGKDKKTEEITEAESNAKLEGLIWNQGCRRRHWQ